MTRICVPRGQWIYTIYILDKNQLILDFSSIGRSLIDAVKSWKRIHACFCLRFLTQTEGSGDAAARSADHYDSFILYVSQILMGSCCYV